MLTLPHSLLSPRSYKLTVKTSFPSQFSGVVEIECVHSPSAENLGLTSSLRRLDLAEPTRSLTLNAAPPLKLLGGVLAAAGARHPVQSVSLSKTDELATLGFSEVVPAGPAMLALRWEGRLDEGGLQGALSAARPTHTPRADSAYAAQATTASPARRSTASRRSSTP